MKHVKMFGKSVPLIAIVMVGMLTIGASAVLVGYLSKTVTSDVTVESPMEVGISTGEGKDWATAKCYRPPESGGNPTETEVADWAYCSCDAGRWWHMPYYTTEAECTEDLKEKCTGACIWYETGGRAAEAPFIGGMVDCFPEGDANSVAWTKTGKLVIPNIHGGETITLYLMSANLANAEIEAHEEIRVYNELGIACEDFESISYRVDSIYGDHGYGRLHYTDDVPATDCHNINSKLIEFWSADDTSTWGAGETDVAQWQITFKDNAFGTYTLSYRIVPVEP